MIHIICHDIDGLDGLEAVYVDPARREECNHPAPRRAGLEAWIPGWVIDW